MSLELTPPPAPVKGDDYPPLECGLHFGVPSRRYHADRLAVTPSLSSGLVRTILTRSLEHARREHPRLGGFSRAQTPAMAFGSAVHAMIGGTFAEEFGRHGFDSLRTKEAKEFVEAVKEAGKTPIAQRDAMEATAVVSAIMNRATAGLTTDIWSAPHAHREVTALWSKPYFGRDVYFRARYDLLESPGDGPWTAWDWKVTSDISPRAVRRKFAQFGYHHQAAHYLAGMDALCPGYAGRHSFVFVFVEASPPYSVRRYCLEADTLTCARIDVASAHSLWAGALASDRWPDASSDKTAFIDVPTYDEDDADLTLT